MEQNVKKTFNFYEISHTKEAEVRSLMMEKWHNSLLFEGWSVIAGLSTLK